jgi:F-type H+-transporting ATPase subunit a
VPTADLYKNYNTIVFSPLEQFEVRDLLSFDAPILGDISLSITNLGLYLTIGASIVLALNILATNYNRIGSNN